MAKRPKFSRWRRNPGTYRFGEQKAPDPNEELQRLTLYVPGSLFDLAESQAVRLGYQSSQDYCTDLILKAIHEAEIKDRVADAETKLGPFEGLHAVADDPAFLDDLRRASTLRISSPNSDPDAVPNPTGIRWADEPDPEPESFAKPAIAAGLPELDPSTPPNLNHSSNIVLRHAGQQEYDPSGFLPSLRRGEPVPPAEVAELAQALHALEIESRGVHSLDRRLAFALHRLAYESQILHTDAFPGEFDIWTIEMLRAVQEAVERILSGQDIRYNAPIDMETETADAATDFNPPYRWEVPR